MNRPGPPAVRALAGLGLAASLWACSTIGEDFELDQANRVRNGMSREEVIAVMGAPPSPVEGGDHGKLVWLYSSADPMSVRMKRVSFSFDENGKVYGIPPKGVIESGLTDDY